MWKDVKGYEGYYVVSDDGLVSSVERDIEKSNGVVQHRKARPALPRENKDGYYTVKLNRDGITKSAFVHRLVATAFIREPHDGEEVNHIDCDRKNNHVDNLEWVSHLDNVRYAKQLGTHVSCADRHGANNPNYGHRSLSKKYKAHPELAMAQSRPGAINGRARKVGVELSGEIVWFDYIKACADYLVDNGYISCKPESAITYIRKAAECGKLYCGFKFVFTA